MTYDEKWTKAGFTKIRSEAHAAQIVRRALKLAAADQSRYRHKTMDASRLLHIKPGAYYKFVTIKKQGKYRLWRRFKRLVIAPKP